MTRWKIVPLAKVHDRAAFDCGEPSLNEFLHRHAGQNARKDVSRTYVAHRPGEAAVAGYYSLSSGSVAFQAAPDALRNRLPRYPIPTAHLGRLAVDRTQQGQGLGEILLVDALLRSRDVADRIGVAAVTVYALNAAAARFYKKFGFAAFADDPHHLYLPMATIRKL